MDPTVTAVGIIVLLIIVILYSGKSEEEYTAAILPSNYPRLIYSVPPYLPEGAFVGVNYRQPTPTQWPPYLTKGQYDMPSVSYVVAPIDWTVNP